MNAASVEDEARLVEHVRACRECEHRLQREAALEIKLEALNAHLPSPKVIYFPTRRLTWLAAAIAAGIVLAVVALTPEQLRVSSGQVVRIDPVICPDGPQQNECIDEAHTSGLVVAYPIEAGAPLLGAIGFPNIEGVPP
ncbi:MAG: hypothetical protein K1X64_19905 [Myxococcaceae bacterium]|nr:hypothetical protein [Myxococcaceae bacterium]